MPIGLFVFTSLTTAVIKEVVGSGNVYVPPALTDLGGPVDPVKKEIKMILKAFTGFRDTVIYNNTYNSSWKARWPW